jgi:hypothetical protein
MLHSDGAICLPLFADLLAALVSDAVHGCLVTFTQIKNSQRRGYRQCLGPDLNRTRANKHRTAQFRMNCRIDHPGSPDRTHRLEIYMARAWVMSLQW